MYLVAGWLISSTVCCYATPLGFLSAKCSMRGPTLTRSFGRRFAHFSILLGVFAAAGLTSVARPVSLASSYLLISDFPHRRTPMYLPAGPMLATVSSSGGTLSSSDERVETGPL